jgi:branched-chain amino acid transport system ATP-binding protein
MTSDCFRIHDLCVSYGYVEAVRSVSFEIKRGGSMALVGHNGAGKSSILLALAGCLESGQSQGRLERFLDNDITSLTVGAKRAAWTSIVPESDKVFGLLTVQENLQVANILGLSGRVHIEDVYAFFPRLAERRKTLAGNLSGGEQQMLAIGSSLLGSPELVLVDEPTLGLAVPAIESICEKLSMLRVELGLTVILAVAETKWVSQLSDSVLVVERGELVSSIIQTHSGIDIELEKQLAGKRSPFVSLNMLEIDNA